MLQLWEKIGAALSLLPYKYEVYKGFILRLRGVDGEYYTNRHEGTWERAEEGDIVTGPVFKLR
jgi:hypothetical protein